MKLFGQTPKQFFSSKSNWTGMTMVATGISAFVAGQIDTTAMLQAVFGGAALIFVKDAIMKK